MAIRRSTGHRVTVHDGYRVRPAVERAFRKHAGKSGIVFDIRWPVTHRYLPATTERVMCTYDTGRETKIVLTRSRLDSRRPIFVPMAAGGYLMRFTSEGWKHWDQFELDVIVRGAQPVLITCWPAKRRFIGSPRPQTTWAASP